jgi:16S rRNA processing protein RimM
MDNYLRVGVITTTHGIHGEVKVFPTTDDITRFNDLKQVIIDTGKELIFMEVENIKFLKQQVIVKFIGIDDINEIEKYRGKDILVSRENAVQLETGEFYICDLIASEVFTDEGLKLGMLTEILQTGANDVYVVKTEDNREVLLPSIKECIIDVDPINKKIIVHIMNGIL